MPEMRNDDTPGGDSVGEYLQSPMTAKDRMYALIGSLVMGAIAVAMWTKPDWISASGSDVPTRARTGLWYLVLKYVWSRPGAVVIAILAALVFWNAIRKKPADS